MRIRGGGGPGIKLSGVSREAGVLEAVWRAFRLFDETLFHGFIKSVNMNDLEDAECTDVTQIPSASASHLAFLANHHGALILFSVIRSNGSTLYRDGPCVRIHFGESQFEFAFPFPSHTPKLLPTTTVTRPRIPSLFTSR